MDFVRKSKDEILKRIDGCDPASSAMTASAKQAKWQGKEPSANKCKVGNCEVARLRSGIEKKSGKSGLNPSLETSQGRTSCTLFSMQSWKVGLQGKFARGRLIVLSFIK